MKKLILFSCMTMAAMTVFAQDVFVRDIGPYEVEFDSEGHVQETLRKDLDLYKFFNLERDTIIEAASDPVRSAIQVEGRFRMPRYIMAGTSNVFELAGSWKYGISDGLYLNAGLSAALSMGRYSMHDEEGLEESFFEFGVPLSIEFARVDRSRASLYGTIGLMPAFYSGVKDVVMLEKAEWQNGKGESLMQDGRVKNGALDEKTSGLLISPQVGVGGYIPVGGPLVRVGVFVQYDINCTKDEHDIFEKRIGRCSVGANVGLVF